MPNGTKPTREQLLNRAVELVEESLTSLSNPGICFACGEEADGCEPDARNYVCESCGQPTVYGAEEAIILLA